MGTLVKAVRNNDIYYRHEDTDGDGINETVCVYVKDFSLPLFGDYRGVEIARILYIPSRPESIEYADKIAKSIVATQIAERSTQ